MSTKIHQTAIVSSKAKLGSDIEVGPFSIIHDDVEIGDGCKIHSHAVIYDGARLSNNVQVYQGASVSNAPQDLKYAGEKTYFYVGENTILREFVTLHRGTVESGKTVVGSNCLIMAYTHVGHDCIIGNNCILANSVQIGGHVEIDDFVIVGGDSPIHQFSKIGKHAFIGGGFKVAADVPPYVLAGESPLKYKGLNVIGLRRRGFTSEQISVLKNSYDILYNSGLNFSMAKDKIKETYPDHPLAQDILDFLNRTNRAIIRR